MSSKERKNRPAESEKLPGYIIRHREFTTVSSLRLGFECWFLLFLLCIVQFHEQAGGVYEPVPGERCQRLRLPQRDGAALR